MKSRDEQAERAYRMAREIIDQEWIAAGVTREELDQADQLADLFDRLVAGGRSSKEINAEWQHKTPEDILHEYAPLVPALHNA